MENKINVGDLVFSLSGRDRGSVYLVIQANEKFAVIVNGKTRKVNKPKKKNLKHLFKIAPSSLTSEAQKIALKEPFSNERLSKAIKIEIIKNGGTFSVKR